MCVKSSLYGLLLVLIAHTGVAQTDGKQKDFGRNHALIAADPVVEPLVQQLIRRLPTKRLPTVPNVVRQEVKKALKHFCLGEGVGYADIVVVPREMDEAERKRCFDRISGGVIKLKLGYEALVLAASVQSDINALTTRQLYLALARDVPRSGAKVPGMLSKNPHKRWSDLGLKPKTALRFSGPPMQSRDGRSVQHLAMEKGCRQWDWVAEMKYSQRNRRVYREVCYRLRDDDVYQPVQKGAAAIATALRKDRHRLGFIAYNDWTENRKGLKAIAVDDTAVSLKTISAGLYPLSRAYYAYVKLDAVKKVPGVDWFLNELASDKALGEGGYLHKHGLVAMSESERKKQIAKAAELTPEPLD